MKKLRRLADSPASKSLQRLAAIRGCIRHGYFRAIVVEGSSRRQLAELHSLFGGDLPPKSRATRSRDRKRWAMTNFVASTFPYYGCALVLTNAPAHDVTPMCARCSFA